MASDDTSSWRIDPDSLHLLAPSGVSRIGSYTASEFASQQWPPCPVCGTTIDVDQIDVTSVLDRQPRFTVGRWECPRKCDPRQGTARR